MHASYLQGAGRPNHQYSLLPNSGPNAQVDFEGDFPIEGAKEVATLMTRYASRPLRLWAAAQQQRLAAEQQAKKGGGSSGSSGSSSSSSSGSGGRVAAAGRLRIVGGTGLTVEPVKVLS